MAISLYYKVKHTGNIHYKVYAPGQGPAYGYYIYIYESIPSNVVQANAL